MKKTSPLRVWMNQAVRKISNCRTALAIHRDVIGLVKDGTSAPTLLHDAAMLLAEARAKLEIEKVKFDIWMAKQRREVRRVIKEERAYSRDVHELAPSGKVGRKPSSDIKEVEIKDRIIISAAYLSRKEVLATLGRILESADKAYFKTLDVRALMIMSLNKVINKGRE